jgi:drug/metabolite transporter, DME family
MRAILQRQTETQGILLILLTSLIWGTTGTVQTLGPEGIDPIAVGAFRIILGGLLISVRARLMHQRTDAPWSPSLVLVGSLFVIIFQFAFFSAIQRTGVVVATVITIGTTPVFAGFLAFLFLRETLRRIWFPATALSILGVIFLTGAGGHPAGVTLDSVGITLALVAAGAYAAQTIVIRRLVQDHPPEMVMSRLFLLASLVVVPVLYFRPLEWLYSVHGIATVLYLGVFATTLAYILFSRGLRSVSGAVAGTVSLAEPAAAAIFGFLLLRETVPSRGILGILCIALALILITVASMRRSGKAVFPVPWRTPAPVQERSSDPAEGSPGTPAPPSPGEVPYTRE